MKNYIFHEGQIPAGYTPGFEESLFNKRSHRLLQASGPWYSFYILSERFKKMVAAIHFHEADSVARSPLRSPFGSIEFSHDLPPNVLFRFITFFENRLKAVGVRTIIIKMPPEAYLPDQLSLLNTFLLNLHYRIVIAEISSVIEIKDNRLISLIKNSEKKRLLKKASRAGMLFKETEITNLREVYSFIRKCHEEKKYAISMTLPELQETVNKFPQRYFLFTVYYENQLVAASIAIQVRQHILYDFYHNHLKAFDQMSPVIFLIDGIHDFCFRNNIRLLDLGTSALENKPNFSLLTFKTRLGGKPTPKFTFEKKLD